MSSRIREISWWYWLFTVILIGMSLFLRQEAIFLAITVGGIQLVHFGIRTNSLTAFPMQVRLVYLGMLLAGLWEPLRSLHWIQFVGTSAVVLVDYCLLARLLSMLPWNREEPISWSFVRQRIFTRPVQGSIQRASVQ